jgi:hypothetical protein
MIEGSPYLLHALKPAPELLPGDLRSHARGFDRCTAAMWLDHGDGTGNWFYMLEDA